MSLNPNHPQNRTDAFLIGLREIIVSHVSALQWEAIREQAEALAEELRLLPASAPRQNLKLSAPKARRT